MHIILLAEHAEPLIGGATHLSKKIAESIAKQDCRVTFIVPNSGNNITEKVSSQLGYDVVKVKAIVPIDDRSKFKRGRRVAFARAVNDFLAGFIEEHKTDVVQILTGAYLLRYLDVPYFQSKGILVIAGILNVPPQECALSWEGDAIISYAKDQVRKQVLRIINKNRIIHHPYDAYTVESESVKQRLAEYVPVSRIYYIPLGTDDTKPVIAEEKKINQPVKILTAGGINPSKNQHIIIEVADILKNAGLSFHWNIIGPDRNSRYTRFIQNQIALKGFEDSITLTLGMPKQQLMEYYRHANIYVQTSIEEGFCMTALDAITYGLPLVGIDTGAIAEFIKKGKGVLVENNSRQMANAVLFILQNPLQFQYTREEMIPVVDYYNWDKIGKDYINLYQQLLKTGKRKLSHQTSG